MTRLVADQETVTRLYPLLLEVVKDEEMVDAACALCTALTIRAYQEGYSLKALRWKALGSITQGWRAIRQYGLPESVPWITTTEEEGNE